MNGLRQYFVRKGEKLGFDWSHNLLRNQANQAIHFYWSAIAVKKTNKQTLHRQLPADAE